MKMPSIRRRHRAEQHRTQPANQFFSGLLVLRHGRILALDRTSFRLAALPLLAVSLDMPSSRRLASHDDHAPRPKDSTLTEHSHA